jgi:hypothetical protein
VVRRKACRGELPVSLQEKIEVLVLLASEGEVEEQVTALQTLQCWPPAELQQVLRDPSTPVTVLEFVAATLAPHREELGEVLLQNPNLTDHVRGWLEGALSLIDEARSGDVSEPPTPTPAPLEDAAGDSSPEPQKQKPTTAIQRTQRMSVVQKVKSALTGTKEERMLLIRDSNKLVARAVMQSPKLTEDEVEKYASMKDVCEDALRVITLNRRFMKLYVIVKALVNNPRTPIDVGLHLLPRVNEFDLKKLAFNHNVADVIRHSAEKIVRRKEELRKPKFQSSKF